MTNYTVQSGDCAWKFAKQNLNKEGATNREIMLELNRLVTLYECKDVEEFNKKYFNKIGSTFELKDSAPKTAPKKEDGNIFGSSENLAQIDTFVAQRESTKISVNPPIMLMRNPNPSQVQDDNISNKIKEWTQWDNWFNLKQEQDRINNLSSDKDKVIEWNKHFNKENKENYIIIDKKSCQAYVYSQNGEMLKQYEVCLARNKADSLLVRNEEHPERNFEATSAGIYTANYRASGRDSYARRYNDRLLQLSNDGLRERGVGSGETGVALHQVPNRNTTRASKLMQPGVSDENNRVSDGCVNFLPNDFDDCMSQIKGVGTKVYILPEEDNNFMCVKNGKLHLAQKEYTGDVATTSPLNDPVKPIKIQITNLNVNQNGQDMAQALADKKTDLIKDLGVDNDTYNELVLLALGIAGQETGYGSPWAGLRKGQPYFIKEKYPFVVNFVKSIKGNTTFNSRGMTQMKIEGYTDNNVKELFKKYNITEESLQNPDKCAEATMIVLANIYKNELPALKTQMQELNISKFDAILYCWSNHKSEIKNGTATPDKNIYVRNVHNFMNDFAIYQNA